MSLGKRVAALEAMRNIRRTKRPRDMTDDELMQAVFCTGEPGWDISDFPGITLAERMEASIAAAECRLEVPDAAMHAARGWIEFLRTHGALCGAGVEA